MLQLDLLLQLTVVTCASTPMVSTLQVEKTQLLVDEFSLSMPQIDEKPQDDMPMSDGVRTIFIQIFIAVISDAVKLTLCDTKHAFLDGFRFQFMHTLFMKSMETIHPHSSTSIYIQFWAFHIPWKMTFRRTNFSDLVISWPKEKHGNHAKILGMFTIFGCNLGMFTII